MDYARILDVRLIWSHTYFVSYILFEKEFVYKDIFIPESDPPCTNGYDAWDVILKA